MQSSMIKSITEDFGNGGIIDGDLTISGDLQVSGGGSLSFDEIIQGTQVIDVTNTEALLVRKNDDGGDVFVVDTTNSKVSISTSAKYGTLTVGGSGEVLSLRSSSGASELHFYEGGTTRGVISSLNGSDGLSLKSGTTERMRITSDGKVGIGTSSVNGIFTAQGTPMTAIGAQTVADIFGNVQQDADKGGGIGLGGRYITNSSSVTAFAEISGVKANNTSTNYEGEMVFKTRVHGGNLTERMRIDGTGDVIFGNTAIFANNKSINFLNTSGAEKSIVSFDNSNITKIGDSSSSGTLQLNSGDATFAGNVTVNGDTLSLVKSNNNAFLKIESTDGGEAIFEMRATTNRTNQIRFFEGATQRGSIVYAHASQSLTFNTGDSATAKLVLDDNSRISLSNNDSGTGNTIFGYKAGNAITTGHNNVVMGNNALLNSQDIGFAVAIGNSAMASGNMTSGADGTVAIGKSALTNLTTGANNVAVGANALDELSTGGYNTAIGVNALHQVDNGESENVAIGYNAGSNLDGDGGTASGNVCIGSNAIPSSSGGLNQIVIGKDTTGRGNNSVTIGNSSITNNYFTGSLSVGDTSPDATLTINQGANDTAIFSLKSSDVGHAVTGIAETDTFLTISKATADQGGALITAITDESTSAEYALALRGILGGDNPDDSDPAIQFISAKRSGTGIADVGSSETAFRFSDSDVTTHYLTITGNGTVSGDLNDTSDISLKENISPLSTALDLVEKMNPVSFDWKDKNKGSNSGFIAQEIEAILPNDVAGNDYVEGKNMGKSVNVTGIVAHLVKAVQELSARVKELENN